MISIFIAIITKPAIKIKIRFTLNFVLRHLAISILDKKLNLIFPGTQENFPFAKRSFRRQMLIPSNVNVLFRTTVQ
ncbi:hypothetical protein Barb4_04628 [Bacteroidales bacterium Barb4]|nr:hypothetical protein Barb4_04628 [Bacteroidales bacterium Barb4]